MNDKEIQEAQLETTLVVKKFLEVFIEEIDCFISRQGMRVYYGFNI